MITTNAKIASSTGCCELLSKSHENASRVSTERERTGSLGRDGNKERYVVSRFWEEKNKQRNTEEEEEEDGGLRIERKRVGGKKEHNKEDSGRTKTAKIFMYVFLTILCT